MSTDDGKLYFHCAALKGHKIDAIQKEQQRHPFAFIAQDICVSKVRGICHPITKSVIAFWENQKN